MNIFTSSFSVARGLDSSRYCVVSIARFVPRGFKGVRCLAFAPSKELLSDYKEGLSESSYKSRYLKELGCASHVHEVFESLVPFCKGRDLVLCCYESADKFCHRHLLADFVKSRWGYVIEELNVSNNH